MEAAVHVDHPERPPGRDADAAGLQQPQPALVRVVTTLVASEVERVRAPERASEAAQAAFLSSLIARELTDRNEIVTRASELGVDVASGAAVVVRITTPGSDTSVAAAVYWSNRLRPMGVPLPKSTAALS